MNKKINLFGEQELKENSNTFQKVSSSINIDKRLFKEDIKASIAHVEMLNRQKIINFKVKNKIIWGLKKIKIKLLKKNIYLIIKMKIFI